MGVVKWTVTAREEFAEVLATLARHAPKYASEIHDRVTTVARLLEDYPYLGPQARDAANPDVREKVLGQYRLVYRVRPGAVVIYAFVPVGEEVHI